MEKLLIIVQLTSTLAMTGIIWLVQIVHYPLFSFVGTEKYREFHAAHMHLISFVVAPTMIVEAVSTVLIVFYPPPSIDSRIFWIGLALVAIVWASTFLWQVPLHEKLALGYDAQTHRALVNTNWVRTIAWSLRALLVICIAYLALK